jgi:hypothetical protein
MDNKQERIAELQQQMLQQLNSALGTNIKRFEELAGFEKFLPEEIRKLKDLCLFLERDFLACEKAGAYFSGCISGASMIEGFLILLCMFNKEDVIKLDPYRKSAKKKEFDKVLGSLSLENLTDIAVKLEWIHPQIVTDDIRRVFADSYEEIALGQGLDAATIATNKQALYDHPAMALFYFMREIRNLLHSGIWIRKAKPFNAAIFHEWAHFCIYLIAEIRNALVIRFTNDLQRTMSEAVAKLGSGKRWKDEGKMGTLAI